MGLLTRLLDKLKPVEGNPAPGAIGLLTGKKTWLAVAGGVGLAAFCFATGQYREGVQAALFALAALGLGDKLNRAISIASSAEGTAAAADDQAGAATAHAIRAADNTKELLDRLHVFDTAKVPVALVPPESPDATRKLAGW